MNLRQLLVLACLLTTACPAPVQKCVSSNECAGQGQTCVNNECHGGSTGGGSGQGGTGGGSTVVTGCDPANTKNATLDTDCDGLTDAEEYGTDYGGKKTDPCNSDSDGDGLPDGLELGRTGTVNSTCTTFVPDSDSNSKTIPTAADTDGDGLNDGAEDLNHNGLRESTETNPLKTDSDCDGYSDKQEIDKVAGCATNPTQLDTDSDGLPDGVEGGLQAPGIDPTGCSYPTSVFDSNPTTGTNACVADTDSDGIQDGAEDTNKNGSNDNGELDPNNGSDAAGPPAQACATTNLKTVTFNSSGVADVQIALVPEFAEVSRLSDSSGERGFIFYDSSTGVAGLAISKTPAGADGTAEELFIRSRLGSVSAPIVQTYTTWDGFAGAVRGAYDVSGNSDIKTQINTVAQNILGGSVAGILSGTAGKTGPFKVQATYVRRTATRAVVVIAFVPAASFTGQTLFRVDDTAGGTALAQFGDYARTQCEVFAASVNAKVDFLWVVDDSGSMKTSQNAVGNVGNAFAAKVNSAGLDWRVGAVTTSYYSRSNAFRAFTSDIAEMKKWFGSSDSSAFGTSGLSIERPFESAHDYITQVLLPRTTNASQNRLRDGATLQLLHLTDTNDQSSSNAASFVTFLRTFDGQAQGTGMHGILCPEGERCGSGEAVIANPAKIQTAIRSMGGVIGDITVANQNTTQSQAQLATIIEAMLSAAIGGTGHQLTQPPIAATIKVAMETGKTRGTCDTSNIPRDRTNGWDIDATSRRIVFYGNCIPVAAGVQVAVSYKYWVDASPDANGDACGGTCMAPMTCDPNQKTCACTDCGGCAADLTCNTNTCVCEPGIN